MCRVQSAILNQNLQRFKEKRDNVNVNEKITSLLKDIAADVGTISENSTKIGIIYDDTTRTPKTVIMVFGILSFASGTATLYPLGYDHPYWEVVFFIAGILAVAYNVQMPSGKFFFKNFPNTEQAVYSFRCVIKPADE